MCRREGVTVGTRGQEVMKIGGILFGQIVGRCEDEFVVGVVNQLFLLLPRHSIAHVYKLRCEME